MIYEVSLALINCSLQILVILNNVKLNLNNPLAFCTVFNWMKSFVTPRRPAYGISFLKLKLLSLFVYLVWLSFHCADGFQTQRESFAYYFSHCISYNAMFCFITTTQFSICTSLHIRMVMLSALSSFKLNSFKIDILM